MIRSVAVVLALLPVAHANASMDAALARHFQPDAPGAAVIVVRDGQTLLRKGYGLADVATGTAMDAGMSLRIGSVTKQFTAAAILMLAQQGKLKLDDDIRRHLPDYPAYAHAVTIRHLLTQSSGIVNYTARPGYMAQLGRDYTPLGLIDTFKQEPLQFAPGQQFSYSNSNYFLLGAIIEQASGMPYAKFVEQHIFIPLGMADTAHAGHERRPPRHAPGHARHGTRYGPAAPISMTQEYASGGLVSTVDDLARWNAALDAGKPIGKEQLAAAFTAQPLADGRPGPYGYGWFIGSFLGHGTQEHGGTVPGYTSAVLRIPEQKLYVAVLRNATDGPSAENLARHAAALALGRQLPFAASELDQFSGVYRIDAQRDHVVQRVGTRLTIQATGKPPAPLVPVSADGFTVGDSAMRVDFQRNAAGAVEKVTITEAGRALAYPRTADLPKPAGLKLPPSVLARWQGRYEIMPGRFMIVRLDGEVLTAAPEGKDAQPLTALSEERFHAQQADAHIAFTAAADGGAHITVDHGGRTMNGKRVR